MLYSLLAADLIMILAGALSYTHLPPQIPLFYTHPWGEDQLADIWIIVLIPLLLHIFFFLNTYIQKKFSVKDSFVFQLFNVTNMFIIVSFTLVFLKVILLVI